MAPPTPPPWVDPRYGNKNFSLGHLLTRNVGDLIDYLRNGDPFRSLSEDKAYRYIGDAIGESELRGYNNYHGSRHGTLMGLADRARSQFPELIRDNTLESRMPREDVDAYRLAVYDHMRNKPIREDWFSQRSDMTAAPGTRPLPDPEATSAEHERLFGDFNNAPEVAATIAKTPKWLSILKGLGLGLAQGYVEQKGSELAEGTADRLLTDATANPDSQHHLGLSHFNPNAITDENAAIRDWMGTNLLQPANRWVESMHGHPRRAEHGTSTMVPQESSMGSLNSDFRRLNQQVPMINRPSYKEMIRKQMTQPSWLEAAGGGF